MKILTKSGFQIKLRYACDGLLNQRLDTPYIKYNGKFEKSIMERSFQYN